MNIDPTEVEKIVREAGSYLLKEYGNPHPQKLKEGTHYDTVQDKIVSDMYQQALKRLYPNVQFYSEEDECVLDPSQPYWMIDPIEGTTNYSSVIPFFATQLAYLEDQKVVYSAVFLPYMDEMYTASLGHGAYCNNKKIAIRQTTSLDTAVVSINKGTGTHNLAWWGQTAALLAPRTRTVRLLGSTGLEISYVAAGKLDLHLNHGSHNYDYAAGSLIASEAGAQVVNFAGEPWNIEDRDIIVGNKELVRIILNLLRQ